MFHWNILKSNTERQYCTVKYNLLPSIRSCERKYNPCGSMCKASENHLQTMHADAAEGCIMLISSERFRYSGFIER